MVGVAVLAITLVPALIPIFVRGRIRSEEENWIVRSFINIYKPMLSFVIDRPAIVWWIMAVILAIGAALINFRPITLIALALGLGMTIVGIRRDGWTMWLVIGLVILVFFVVAADGCVRATTCGCRRPGSGWPEVGSHGISASRGICCSRGIC